MLDTRIDLTYSDSETEIILSGDEHSDFTAVRISIGRSELSFFVKDADAGENLLGAIEAATPTMKVTRTAVTRIPR